MEPNLKLTTDQYKTFQTELKKAINVSSRSIKIIQIKKDLQNASINNYDTLLTNFMTVGEGIRKKAYDDDSGKDIIPGQGKPAKGKRTVGIGFNMERPGAKADWIRVFPSGKPDFDKVIDGIEEITDEDSKKLYTKDISIRRKELKGIYLNVWEQLLPNERAVIEDGYYNGPGLVGYKNNIKSDGFTNFYKCMIKYANNRLDPNFMKYLDRAVYELLVDSNPEKKTGTQNRRITEAFMLCDSLKAVEQRDSLNPAK